MCEIARYRRNLEDYVTNVTKAQLEGAPKYANDSDGDWSDTTAARSLNDYYGTSSLACCRGASWFFGSP